MVRELSAICRKLYQSCRCGRSIEIFAFVRALGFVVFTTPAVAHAEYEYTEYVGDVTGSVTLIKDDGSVIITNGAVSLHIVLWGLSITDTDGLRSFLMERQLDCKIVHELGPVPEADCLVYPKRNGKTIFSKAEMRGQISVFDWISDLGFAIQKCPFDYGWYSVSDGAGRFWHCAYDREPSYRTDALYDAE